MRETGLPSFGEKLKLEREKRKITLEQISSSTKIGTRMLQALEEDKFNQLPGGIFNKGFVRAYSRCVGLDEDQTVADYLEASGDAPPVSTEVVPLDDEGRENRGKYEENLSRLEAGNGGPARQLPWGWFAAVLLVVALALSFWSHRRREPQGPPVPSAATTPATQAPAPPPSGASGKDTNINIANRAPSATSASPTTASAVGKPATSIAPKTSQDATAATPAAAPGEFTIVIQAREESWISITYDGRAISSELMPAGSERTVHGRREIIVKAGNAGGVDFRFNGQKLEVGGESGEVRTVTFGPRGILPNAPAPPSTP
ncbi:MAG: helix-turn-helix domain-containing protein [Terriglobales bacterium]